MDAPKGKATESWLRTLDKAARVFSTEFGAGLGVTFGLVLGGYLATLLGMDWSFLLYEVTVPAWLIALGLILWLGADR